MKMSTNAVVVPGSNSPVPGSAGAVATPSPTPEPVIVDANGPSKSKEPPLQMHYNELLRVITDIGRDVKPAYTSSKSSIDKLRKNIMVARTLLRECQSDLERLGAMP